MTRSCVAAALVLIIMIPVCGREPHVVAWNARPEIIILSDRIYIEGREVVIYRTVEVRDTRHAKTRY
jgi:hypothetical protein